MAAPDAAVTDTHPLIFHASGGRGLSPRVARLFERCESRDAVIYVPTAVIWECSLLARVSRINLRRSVRAFFDDLFSNPAFQPLDLSPEQIYVADEMGFTRDPFDALICAAAQVLDMPLISRDAKIRGAGIVAVVW